MVNLNNTSAPMNYKIANRLWTSSTNIWKAKVESTNH